LNDLKVLFRDKLIGPKSVAVAENGDLFTGTYGGHVHRIKDDNSVEIYTTIPDGRPLGMRIDSNGKLYFTEANSGLYVSDLKTKTVKKLIGFSDTKFGNNKESKFFDDLVVVENRDEVCVYITDVSNKFSLDYWSYTYLEPDPTGRVIKYDLNSKKVSVVLDHLYFPNGIEVNDDKTALLINELAKRRILKHYISGPKAGNTEILIENLPGEPDNIRLQFYLIRK
jgi:sugar lactone lactonase YvrE